MSRFGKSIFVLGCIYRRSLHFNIPQSGLRCVVFGSNLTSKRFCSKDVSPFDPPKLSVDGLKRKLNSATNVDQVFSLLDSNIHDMDAKLVMASLRTIFNLQKSGRSDLSIGEVLKQKEFVDLWKQLKKHMIRLPVNEIVESLKILMYFQVPTNTIIMQYVLKMLREEINNLSMQHIVFLSFLLKSFPEDPTSKALKIALPIVLESQLKTKLDLTNVGDLVDVLRFATKNKMSESCFNYIAEGLLDLPPLDWEMMTSERAKSIILSLSELKFTSDINERLFDKALNVLKNSSRMNLEPVLSVCSKKAKKDFYFYNEDFFDFCARKCISEGSSFAHCGFVLRHLNRLGHVNIQLLDYISGLILEQPDLLVKASFGFVFSYLDGLVIANHKPKDFPKIETALMENNSWQEERTGLPYIKLALNMASLNIFHDSLIDRIYNEEFLKNYLDREHNTLDLVHFLLLYQVISTLHTSYTKQPPEDILNEAKGCSGFISEFPLRGALEKGLGGPSYLITKCFTKLGHSIDHAVVMRRGGYPVAHSQPQMDQKFFIEDLTIPANSYIVLILAVPPTLHTINTKKPRGISYLPQRTLEALGHIVVSISLESWLALADFEKIPYLMEAIKEKDLRQAAGEIGAFP